MESGLHILVLTCGDLGFEVAERLLEVSGIANVTIVISPYRTPKRRFLKKIEHVWRYRGLIGFFEVLAGRFGFGDTDSAPAPPPTLTPAIKLMEVDDFHAQGVSERIRDLKPDLGVVAGTYILKESVFGIPRMGSINLHSGKAPEYRGAAPVFWELYNGEHEVGVTIHRVTKALDSGHILAQEFVPIDPAPKEDVLLYIERVRRESLRPTGVRLMTEAVSQIAKGIVKERPQDHTKAHTYRSPDRRDVSELRRRIQARQTNA